MTGKATRRQYDAEFKKNAVDLIALNDGKLNKTANDLGINPNTLCRWKRELKPDFKTESEPEIHIKNLKKQLRTAELERDILKKALAIFSRLPE